ncbi:hypothetical protein [Pimelobacter simplex]|uniref:hypothetical protein n=1 Tax=Nocardioides simplex TaxID=2045 RepID=UPI0021502472|nr:hypothetical protein [Pimelobacter simplex]UUW90316.1 hypothetical protein M0M43_02180 [Pimelobacter simplex]UUW94146.1 hypothetical protein M0M48_20695 [Pimelobacter simplex]
MRRVLMSLLLGIAVVTPAALTLSPAAPQPARCGSGDALSWTLPGACQHVDEPPPGVDPTEPVSTAVLRARDGGTAGAYDAAEALGVPAPVQAAAASPAVTCEGDGASGYRTQAMYVVEAGRTNRFAALLPSFRLWAAGVDDVVNRSAALTGGVRKVRFVTDPDGGTCVAKVLNVTVPAGAMSSFNATIAAVQALGYTDPSRKYLMWTDATVLCGVASMYPDATDGQGNPNNGRYAQYARIDSGCWGFGDGAAQHSVEAHELLHTLGGVMSTAPHGTRAGHCWDESDTMCYADGGGFAMKQVCPAEREYLFDCNNDDYYSTYPDPGSWLDTHWNAADSRFLIGGGDGSGGGAPGTPSVLGATIAVNNPAVPGLSTQATLAPSLPAGRTVASVQWKSARADCVFASPAELQTAVTCNATAAAPTTVTATLKDSSGATKVVTSPLTFATGTARPVTVAFPAGTSAAVCTGAGFPLTARVLDTASGQPVKGLAVALTKQSATMTAPASAGAPVTTVEGTVILNQTAAVATTYRARTAAGTVYAAGGPAELVATPGRCATSLAAEIDRTTAFYGDPVTVTGRLTAAVPSGVTLAVRLTTAAGRVLPLGSAKTGADGRFSLVAKPTESGVVSVALAVSVSYAAASATAGTLTVVTPTTRITGAVDRSEVGYGQNVTVTGRLQRDAGGTLSALAGKPVSVYVAPAGGGAAVKIGGGTTNAEGRFTAVVPLKVSGTLSVTSAAAAGQPAASAAVGPVVAGTWTTALTATASASSVPAGGSVTLSGSVSRTYAAAGATAPSPASGLRLKVTFRATGSATSTVVGTPTTTAGGTFTLKVLPKGAGTWTVSLPAVAGYTAAEAAPLTIGIG